MKKLVTVLAAGALFTLSMAGMSAADTDINIYGASAQHSFWSSLVSTWMTSYGCATPTTLTVDTTSSTSTTKDGNPAGVYYHGAKYFIATASGCPGVTGNLNVRVGAYDSYDGIAAIKGITNPIDVGGCTGKFRTQLNSVAGGNSPANLTCVETTLGASDVNGLTIIQSTEGQLGGPAGPVSPTYGKNLSGATINADLGDFTVSRLPGSNYQLSAVSTCGSGTGLIDNHPLVVPFGFFANKSGSLNTNLTNITQGMAQQIFSQNVTDWQTFFPSMSSTPIVLCLRVAGSGTYATFDAAVMRTNGVGPSLPAMDHSLMENNVWFNNTSGNMMDCINNNPGAIGFADADASNKTNTFGPIPFNGTLPTATNIKNGLYDRFWSLEHVLQPDPAPVGYPTTIVNAMMEYASANIPSGKATYWANSKDMKIHKVTDFTYPPQLDPYDAGACYE